jgi:hypothetical protein
VARGRATLGPLCMPCCRRPCAPCALEPTPRGGVLDVTGAMGGKDSVSPARCARRLRLRRLASFKACTVQTLCLEAAYGSTLPLCRGGVENVTKKFLFVT